MLHGGERGRFVNRHCASFWIGTTGGMPYHGRANLARDCHIRKWNDFRICSDLGGWQHWRFTASCGGRQFHLMQIIRDFSGAASVSSVRQGISVCRLKPPFGFLHILTDRSRLPDMKWEKRVTLCRLSHYVWPCRVSHVGFPQESEIPIQLHAVTRHAITNICGNCGKKRTFPQSIRTHWPDPQARIAWKWRKIQKATDNGVAIKEEIR